MAILVWRFLAILGYERNCFQNGTQGEHRPCINPGGKSGNDHRRTAGISKGWPHLGPGDQPGDGTGNNTATVLTMTLGDGADNDIGRWC
ncbi:hypothetical protein BC941DRAFT_510301 [Chlamydoabsidia padenii]|nr:hypothetical protein BC941DRAFT_510301 [Chlamydoabsidia padenii]